MEHHFIDFTQKTDNGVLLNVFENVPFDIRRVYTIRGIKAHERRGNHAHHTNRQVLVALHGSCKVTLDDGENQEIIELDSPKKGILLDSYIWHTMYDFSDDTTLLCLASQPYDEKDYMRDYSEFLSKLPIENVPGY